MIHGYPCGVKDGSPGTISLHQNASHLCQTCPSLDHVCWFISVIPDFGFMTSRPFWATQGVLGHPRIQDKICANVAHSQGELDLANKGVSTNMCLHAPNMKNPLLHTLTFNLLQCFERKQNIIHTQGYLFQLCQ